MTVARIEIGDGHLAVFRRIKERFIGETAVPEESSWRSLSNNDIWLYMIEQVIAVGGSRPSTKFHENADLRSQVSLQALGDLEDRHQLIERINHVLRAVGSRYASSDVSRCRKTQALVYNFEIIKTIRGGPKGLLEEISEMHGSDVEKARYLMKRFKFIKSKNARDLLMEMGMARDVIALDVRIKNVFKKIGIKFPNGFESNPRLYDEFEREILENICRPLGISGLEMDRMLYQNYTDIMSWI